MNYNGKNPEKECKACGDKGIIKIITIDLETKQTSLLSEPCQKCILGNSISMWRGQRIEKIVCNITEKEIYKA